MGLNCDQMEHLEGDQYSQYPVERNLRAYMSMRDYRNLPWQNQQAVERNPNPNRSMRDYRNQWMSAPFCSVRPTYAPPASPYWASTPQPPQPPQSISSIEQAILNLTKMVGDVVEEQKTFNAQLRQRIHTVENSLRQKLDGLQSGIDHQFDNLQSGIDHKFDNLQKSISRFTQQHVHSEEENLEGECLSDTMVEEQCLQQLQEGLVENFEPSYIGVDVCPLEKKEAISPLLTEEALEEYQKHNLPLPPTDSVYILPSPASQSQPKTPTAQAKAIPSPLPILQNLKKLVASIQAFAITSKTLAAAHTAWHNGWFGCWFIMEHMDLSISTSSTSSNSFQRLERLVWGEHSLPNFLFSFFLFYFILF